MTFLPYFLLSKLLTFLALVLIFIVIPCLTAFFVFILWPTKTKGAPFLERERQVFVRPIGWRVFWISVVVSIGLLCYGAQLNWIFNLKPSRVFDALTSTFFESFSQHRERIENDYEPTRINIRTEIRRYELVSYNPPKHFYVTIKDVQTQTVFELLYVSKHCNAADNNKIGDVFNINVTSYTLSNRPGVVFYDFHNLYGVFC